MLKIDSQVYRGPVRLGTLRDLIRDPPSTELAVDFLDIQEHVGEPLPIPNTLIYALVANPAEMDGMVQLTRLVPWKSALPVLRAAATTLMLYHRSLGTLLRGEIRLWWLYNVDADRLHHFRINLNAALVFPWPGAQLEADRRSLCPILQQASTQNVG